MQLLGPNTFPFSRLVMIFQSIIDDEVTLSANLISQVPIPVVYLYYVPCKCLYSCYHDVNVCKYGVFLN